MMDALFGSSAPMWTAAPLGGFAWQAPVPFANPPLGAPVFAPTTPSNVAAPFPFAANSSAANGIVSGNAIGLTAPSLLLAVAMRRGQPQGPTNDQEVEDFIYDAFELLSGAADVDVRCEGGRATLTGTVQHKRVKRDVGEIAWAIPALNDVQNNVTITSRRRARAGSRETEVTSSAASRKQG